LPEVTSQAESCMTHICVTYNQLIKTNGGALAVLAKLKDTT